MFLHVVIERAQTVLLLRRGHHLLSLLRHVVRRAPIPSHAWLLHAWLLLHVGLLLHVVASLWLHHHLHHAHHVVHLVLHLLHAHLTVRATCTILLAHLLHSLLHHPHLLLHHLHLLSVLRVAVRLLLLMLMLLLLLMLLGITTRHLVAHRALVTHTWVTVTAHHTGVVVLLGTIGSVKTEEVLEGVV